MAKRTIPVILEVDLERAEIPNKEREFLSKKPTSYKEVLSEMRKRNVHSQGGVYGLFWVSKAGELRNKKWEHDKNYKGSLIRKVIATINLEWLRSCGFKEIPLYIGATWGLANRIRGHVTPKNPKTVTTAQVKKALVELRPKFDIKNTELFGDNGAVKFKYVVIENPIARFYLENRLIGKLLPVFNFKPEH